MEHAVNFAEQRLNYINKTWLNYKIGRNYIDIVKEWLTNLSQISKIGSESELLTELNIHLFDTSMLVSFTDSDIILDSLKAIHVKFQKENLKTSFEKEVDGIVLKFNRFSEYKFFSNDFKMSIPKERVISSPIKYITNVDAFKIQTQTTNIINLMTKEDYTYTPDVNFRQIGTRRYTLENLREVVLMNNFVRKYSASRRHLKISKLIQIVFETSHFSDDRGFIWYNNPTLYALSRLMAQYKRFPFIEKDDEVEYLETCSFHLLETCYMLVELWFKYLLLDIGQDELRVAILIYLDRSLKSFDEWMLEFKDVRQGLLKVLIHKSKNSVIAKYGMFGPHSLEVNSCLDEVWADNEITVLFSEFLKLAPKPLVDYCVNKLIVTKDLTKFDLRKTITSLSEARRLFMFISISCQHGLFIKNPVALTIEKSILPRSNIVPAPMLKSKIVKDSIQDELGLAFTYDRTVKGTMSDIYAIGESIFDKYIDSLNKLDLGEEFVRALTANSGGVDYIPTENEKLGISDTVLRTLGRKRLIYYILRTAIFEIESEWMIAIQEPTSSGERKQVDRRPRVIQMVSNVGQLGPFLLYLCMDLMSSTIPEFSSKKNSGTIRDLTFILRSTSDTSTYIECSDISGMDARTTRVHTRLINDLLRGILQRCDHMKYFFKEREVWTEVEFDKNGNVYATKEVSVHPATLVSLYTEHYAESNNFRLNINEMNAKGVRVTTDTSDDAFPSGRFSTSSQHTILNLTILRALEREFTTIESQSGNTQFSINSKTSGDDIISSIKFSDLNDAGAGRYSSHLNMKYKELGFELTSSLSRNSATYLQQTAAGGMTVPKPDRISITTSEHGESLKSTRIEAFEEVRSIAYELCSRCPYPSNAKCFLIMYANQMRRIRIKVGNSDSNVDIGRNKSTRSNKSSNFILDEVARIQVLRNRNGIKDTYSILTDGIYIHLVYPFISLFLREGFDLPLISTGFNQFVSGSTIFSPGGSYRNWKIRKILHKITLTRSEIVRLDEELISNCSRLINTKGGGITSETVLNVSHAHSKVRSLCYETIRSRYDFSLARKLGIGWFARLSSFNELNWLKRYRLTQIPSVGREELASMLENRLSLGAIIRSRLAHFRLNEFKYNVPGELAFHRSPSERVNQVITSGTITTTEFIKLRESYLLSILTYVDEDTWFHDVDEESLYTLDYFQNNQVVSTHYDAGLNIGGAIMPSSGHDLAHDLIISRVGMCFFEFGSSFKGYYGLKPGPWKDYNHEALVRFATRVYNTNPNHLQYVWQLANIPERYQSQLKVMIETGDTEVESAWKSILHTRKMFDIGTSVWSVNRNWNSQDFRDMRMQAICNLFMRDIVYSEIGIGMRQFILRVPFTFLLIQNKKAVKIKSLLALGSSMIIN
uniref:RNA-directed RNA polymerase n=1 Tax=Zoersel tick virus TaxID=2867438 RepID=A0A8G0QEE9_9REOV|nr:RNA-dependent RNA polymerase [Zoersel tick virus]